jgi:hypothetical protein
MVGADSDAAAMLSNLSITEEHHYIDGRLGGKIKVRVLWRKPFLKIRFTYHG